MLLVSYFWKKGWYVEHKNNSTYINKRGLTMNRQTFNIRRTKSQKLMFLARLAGVFAQPIKAMC